MWLVAWQPKSYHNVQIHDDRYMTARDFFIVKFLLLFMSIKVSQNKLTGKGQKMQ